MHARRLRGAAGIVVALLATAVMAGCSDDDGDAGERSGAAGSVSAEAFCEDFSADGGSETSIRPVPAALPVVRIRSTLERGQEAMEGVTPATDIKASWDALAAHYTAVAGLLEQAPQKGKLPKAQRRQLQQQTDDVFSHHGRDVINYILRHCT